MAGRRLSMRKIKEVLRLKWHHGQSNKQIALSCKVSRATVSEYLSRAERAGLTWPPDTTFFHENYLPAPTPDSFAGIILIIVSASICLDKTHKGS